MNLLIDIGNSRTKIALAKEGKITYKTSTDQPPQEWLNELLSAHADIDSVALSSVREPGNYLCEQLKKQVRNFLILSHDTPLPITNLYATVTTLGIDRLAAAVGAHTIFPGENVLIVDFGSAITIDYLNARGEFTGGNISPGAGLRFRSLHAYTEKLPLCDLPEHEVDLFGNSTLTAIQFGVVNGIVFEIEKYIARIATEVDDFKIIFTGGDGKYFAEKLKNTIFVSDELIFLGLNRVIDYNQACSEESIEPYLP